MAAQFSYARVQKQVVTLTIAERVKKAMQADAALSEADALSQIFREDRALYERYRETSSIVAREPLASSAHGNCHTGLRTGDRKMPRVQYLIDEMTFDREQGSHRQQLEALLTQRGDEGWELVSMMVQEAQTEDTSAGVRTIRSANLLLVFKRLNCTHG
jgi:hypothetical protein